MVGSSAPIPLRIPQFAAVLEAALWWVRIVPVVPVAPALSNEGPRPMIKWKEDGPLRTEAEIRGFWERNPRAQIAIVLGKVAIASEKVNAIDEKPAVMNRMDLNNLFLGAIDTDLKNRRDGMPEPPTGFYTGYRHSTKSGGFHDPFLYKVAPPETVKRRSIGIGGFVDVLLDGLLVVPPTKFDGSGDYRVVRDGPIPEFEAVGLALDHAAPWLREAWKHQRPQKVAAARPDIKEPILEGSRHPTLLSRAGKLRDLGVGADAILTDLRDFNERRCRPPLPETEVAELARDVAQRYEPTREPAPLSISGLAPCADLAEALAIVTRIVKTKDPVGPYAILAAAAQDWAVDLLTSVFYVGFKGRTGSGKGTAVESTILLTRSGEILSNATPAYLNDLFNSGNTAVGFQQADKTIQKDETVKAILLNGYRRGASSGIMVPASEGRGWVRSKLDIFGLKVYDFPVTIDTHLLSRSVVLDMETDNSVDRALDGEDKAEALAPVRLWLEAQSIRIKQKWTRARVAGLRQDRRFRSRVAALRGVHGRDHVIGAALLLVSDLYGWDQEEASRQLLSRRRQVEDFSQEEEVHTYLEGLWDGTPDFLVTFDSVLEGLNEKRGRARLDGFSSRGLSSLLQDLGLRKDSGEWFKPTSGPMRKKWVVKPGRLLAEIGANGSNGGNELTSDGRRLPPLPSMPPVTEGLPDPGTSDLLDDFELFPAGYPTKADRARGRLGGDS
jgi:hypothetical protein